MCRTFSALHVFIILWTKIFTCSLLFLFFFCIYHFFPSLTSFTFRYVKQLWSRFEHEVGVAVMLRAPVFAHADWFSVKHNDVDEAVVEC